MKLLRRSHELELDAEGGSGEDAGAGVLEDADSEPLLVDFEAGRRAGRARAGAVAGASFAGSGFFLRDGRDRDRRLLCVEVEAEGGSTSRE